MSELNDLVVSFLASHPDTGIASIRASLAPRLSHQSIWRLLQKLVVQGMVETQGKGRATVYRIAGSAAVRLHLKTPHARRIPVQYRPSFLDAYVPNKTFYFSLEERAQLLNIGSGHSQVASQSLLQTHLHRQLERLIIDLSWASSRMEGNTYDILETERLIRFGQEATGKDHKEAIMILNHKQAIQYLLDHLSTVNICHYDCLNVHALLSNGLLIDPAMSGRLRKHPVGISYSSYSPLEDHALIEEEFRVFLHKAAAISDPFEQSLFLLVHLPYIQPFADVNKRTSRVVSNIPLLKASLAPLSFAAMNDAAYIDALLGVYELNNVTLLKELYIDAYRASAQRFRLIDAESHEHQREKLLYRDFIRATIRKLVLDGIPHTTEAILQMARLAQIPEGDISTLTSIVLSEFHGLHEGNVIRYDLTAADINQIFVCRLH